MESLIWWSLLLIFVYKVRSLYVKKQREIRVPPSLYGSELKNGGRPYLVAPKADKDPISVLTPNLEINQKKCAPPPLEPRPRPGIANIECGICHTNIRIPIRPATAEHQCPKCLNSFITHNTNGVLTAVFRKNMEHINDILQKSGLALTEADAYAVLGVDATTTWDLIEKTRRGLLNQYHPDKVEALGPKLKELATSEVTKINLAYAMLKQIREGK